ncbi:hypothetical protein FJ872_17865 [Mesorhizobium sp. B2-5-9]|uniref:hypothetical protein n=1 Tax=Mesorhizobium sp. B2-5-9 TaxID=2589921 RepID=UPI00112CE672|nr:hypothetical protein [Mesorhizobium sp. B2-5-9]TPK16669.1 hypothetical protein FJ872_17865 [Mesorhizobium sp. B2-5-9]
MEDVNAGAPAPAETTVAPAQEPVNPPAPVSSEPPKAETKPEPKVEEKKAPTTREALKSAAEKVAEKAKAEEKPVQAKPAEKPTEKPADKNLPELKAEAKPEPKAEPVKTGTHQDMPARFKSDTAASAEWEKAPEAVKAAVHRSFRELEAGIEKHRASAEEFEPLKPYSELAKQHGTTIPKALDNYLGLEKMLSSQDQGQKMAGLQRVFDYAGVNIRDFAARVMGQTPDQVSSSQDATIRELRQELAGIKQQVGGVTNTIQQQHVATVNGQVQAFAADHPRFDELAEDIAFFLKSGKTKDLAEAYKLAERLNPAPVAEVTAAPQTRTTDNLEAQTLKGGKSVTGAPSAGSDPATKRASTSIKDSLRRAMAQTG